jgi:hypothetical protein
MTPDKTLLQGKPYTPACATDIRNTWAKHCPMWAERVKMPLMPLPVARVETHYKPRVK